MPGGPPRHRGDGEPDRTSCPACPAAGFHGQGAGVDGSGDQSAVAGGRPTRGTPRTLRCTSLGTVGDGRCGRSLRVVPHGNPRGRFGSRSPGQVLQRSVPGGRPPRTPSRARGRCGRSVSRRPVDQTPRAPAASALNHVGRAAGLADDRGGDQRLPVETGSPCSGGPDLAQTVLSGGNRQATVENARLGAVHRPGRRHPAAQRRVPVPTRRR